ncbi:hypothetical protein [Bifidobacterium callitrichidarum]|uniref:Uncharacterized protein n=1 Tax=Bifidobacterium callitrichidarum TaxID=2052941 RepID=A0A2U2N920_9BIFI|nr:hypothetical protein [Bifidobacterium callitrichidarum]PWG65603.1 hypothetical protein DF196_06630 [Bifidobacterium callitrichidarum]
MEDYRLKTSFTVPAVDDAGFAALAGGFQRRLTAADGITDATVLADIAGHRLHVGFDVKAKSFRDANYRCARLILETLASSDGMVGVIDFDSLPDRKAVEEAGRPYMTHVVRQLTQVRRG